MHGLERLKMNTVTIHDPISKNLSEFAKRHMSQAPAGHKFIARSLCGLDVFTVFCNLETNVHFIQQDNVKRTGDEWRVRTTTEMDGAITGACPDRLLLLSNYAEPTAVKWREDQLKAIGDAKFLQNALPHFQTGDTLLYSEYELPIKFLLHYANTTRVFQGTDAEGNVWKYNVNKLDVDSVRDLLNRKGIKI